MGQSIQAWKAGNGEHPWLSTLIDAMEQAARPELRSKPCDGLAVARFREQLSLPSIRFTSTFSLHN
jgi:hypothetical protein